ncbi:MAG: hypothetical protein MUP70_08990 [Candidatus Aminicenantes bacterium]|nr:hypothetical protein [Candidatus Aminicenantes bacterium]
MKSPSICKTKKKSGHSEDKTEPDSVHSSAVYQKDEKGVWVVRNPAGSICYNNLYRNPLVDEDGD